MVVPLKGRRGQIEDSKEPERAEKEGKPIVKRNGHSLNSLHKILGGEEGEKK